MYADTVTGSMARAIGETERRRKIQSEYNTKHGIVPKTIIKDVRDVIEIGKSEKNATKSDKKLTRLERERLIEELTKQMKAASAKLEFEQAAYLRDRIKELRNPK